MLGISPDHWFMAIQTVVFLITLLVLIRQNGHLQRTIYASTYSRMIEMLKDLRAMRIEDPTLAQVYKGDTNGKTEQEIRHHFFNLIVLSIAELLFVNRKLKLAPDRDWDNWIEAIRHLAQEPSFRAMVLGPSRKIVHPEFEGMVKQICLEVEEELQGHGPKAKET